MHVVVTGAAGFIGSHLCERLLNIGHKVTGIDNFDSFYSPQIKIQNIAGFREHPRFYLVHDDIRSELAALALQDQVDAVVHLAARAGVRPSIENPVLYSEVNVVGTVKLLDAAIKSGVQKFIFGSSSSVYGNAEKVPFSESDNVDFPISPYAATKKAGELICHAYHNIYNIDVTCLRFFTVYGPRQRPDLAIHKFTELMFADKPIPFFGDGSMTRDYTYIDDIVSGIVSALDNASGYHIYNLGNSSPVSLQQLIFELELAIGKKAVLQRLPEQPGDVHQTYADISLANAELGYVPMTKISDGIFNFVQWFKKNKVQGTL